MVAEDELMNRRKDLMESAGTILTENPDPVIKFLLLRDVLKKPQDDMELARAREDLSKNVSNYS